MPDDPTNQDPASNQPDPSKNDPVPDKGNTPDDKAKTDAVTMAKELGETKAKLEMLQKYQEQVDPFLVTVQNLDEETRNKLTEAHNKRLGITPKDEDPKKDDKIAITPPSATEIDNRNAIIKGIVDNFSTSHGITKLTEEDKKTINTKIGVELQEMLDPMGNKTLQQIMETVSVTKLPQYLEKAYFLATRDKQLEEAKDQGKKEAVGEGMGIIGSIPSSSLEASEVALTAKEKAIAAKQGVSEEKYLENKKAILARNGELF